MLLVARGLRLRADGRGSLAAGRVATLPPLLARERADDAWVSLRRRSAPAPGVPEAPSFGHFARSLLAALRRPRALALLLLCFTVEFAVNGFQVRFAIDMVQAGGWDAAALSRLQAGLTFASGTLGALAVGLWSDRIGATGAVLPTLDSGTGANTTSFSTST